MYVSSRGNRISKKCMNTLCINPNHCLYNEQGIENSTTKNEVEENEDETMVYYDGFLFYL